MKPNFKQKVSNWGNFPIVEKEMKSEDSLQKIKDYVRNHNDIIARGNGRCYNMIVVGASTNDNEFLRADFSNYNRKMVNVFAPGDKIYSTVPQGKYEYLQGTSMASPVVAGAASILLAYMPNLKPEQIIESLVKTSNKSTVNAMIKSNTNNQFNLISEAGGVIDVRKAAEYAYTNFYKAGNSTSVKSPASKKVYKKTTKKTAKKRVTAK